MKKLIIAAAVLTAISTTSCKKNRMCVCTKNGVDFSTNTLKATKKKAKNECRDMENSFSSIGGDVTCEIR